MKRKERKINKLKVGILVFIFLMFLLTVTGFSRFVYNGIRDKYLTSKKFYFTSNLLDGKRHDFDNWDGIGVYDFDIELYSKINDLQKLEEDLEYTIMVNFPDEVNCAINETDFQQPVVVKEGDEEKLVVTKPISKDSTIFAKIDGEYNNRDSAKIYVKAIDDETIFENGKYIDIEVTAYTTKPYRKSIKSTFRIKISTSYRVQDAVGQKYAILTVRNTSTIPQDMTIKISNPNKFLFDMNDDAYVYKNGYNYLNDLIVGNSSSSSSTTRYGNLSEVTFEIPAESSKLIKIYKTNYNDLVTTSHFTISKKEAD